MIDHESVVSGFPLANRRETRKLGLLQGKSSEVEREGMEPLERMSVFAGNARHRYTSNGKFLLDTKADKNNC